MNALQDLAGREVGRSFELVDCLAAPRLPRPCPCPMPSANSATVFCGVWWIDPAIAARPFSWIGHGESRDFQVVRSAFNSPTSRSTTVPPAPGKELQPGSDPFHGAQTAAHGSRRREPIGHRFRKVGDPRPLIQRQNPRQVSSLVFQAGNDHFAAAAMDQHIA